MSEEVRTKFSCLELAGGNIEYAQKMYGWLIGDEDTPDEVVRNDIVNLVGIIDCMAQHTRIVDRGTVDDIAERYSIFRNASAALSSPEGVQEPGETSEPSLRNQPEPDAALCHCLVHCRGGIIPDGVRCRELPISPEAASWITGEPPADHLRTTDQSSVTVMNEQTPLPEEVTGERGEAPSESAGEDSTLTAITASSGSETLTTGLAGLSNEASDQTSNSPKQLCEEGV